MEINMCVSWKYIFMRHIEELLKEHAERDMTGYGDVKLWETIVGATELHGCC